MRRQVSVILPAHNCAPFITAAIDSACAQTCPPDEVIAIDDGSIDGTDQIIEQHPSRNTIRLIKKANGGASSARNAGIEAARGEWIAFLDGDDRWLPRWLECAHALLDRHPDLDWLCGAHWEDPIQRPRRLRGLSPAGRVYLRDQSYFDNVFDVFDQHCGVWTSAVIIHRRCLEEAGAFDPDLRRREDVDLWTRIGLRRPRIGWVDEPVAEYVRRPGSLTDTLPEMSAREMVKLLRKRVTEYPAGEALARPYARYLATQGCKGWLHACAQEELRAGLREFPELLPPGWIPWLRVLAAMPASAFAVNGAILNARLRLLGRDRRSRAAGAW